MTRDHRQPDDSTRVDPEIAAQRANAASVVELTRAGYPGHMARLAALRRAGRVLDQNRFQALEREGLT